VGVSEPAVSATVLQKKVFDFKPARGLEQIGYEGCKQVDDREHRIG